MCLPPNVCVCLSPEALQPGLILSILQSPYLPFFKFIYLSLLFSTLADSSSALSVPYLTVLQPP